MIRLEWSRRGGLQYADRTRASKLHITCVVYWDKMSCNLVDTKSLINQLAPSSGKNFIKKN